MTNFQTDYQALNSAAEDSEPTAENDVIFHVPPGKPRWNHIKDLDTFFILVYEFHQRGGFSCIVISEFFNLLQYIFMVIFPISVYMCVDYGIVGRQSHVTQPKSSITDLIVPVDVCVANFNAYVWFYIVVGSVFCISYFCRALYKIICFYDIRNFYICALKISTCELQNMPWHEIQSKVREAQREQQMCIHKRDLTELDIHHRLLRQENYMVAMVNKNIFPVNYNIRPFGEVTYFPPLFVQCLEFILFRRPFSPFVNTWTLRDEYKRFANRHKLATELCRAFSLAAFVSFLLCGFAFIFEVMYICVNYAGFIRKEPSILSLRKWSSYSLLRLRLFNELEHEFSARLNRAYKPATQYMNSFKSMLVSISMRYISALTGFIAVYFLVWGTIQPEVIEYDGFLAVGAFCTCICAMGFNHFAEQNRVYVPEALLMRAVGEIHYMPDYWVNKAHTVAVRQEFSRLFQLRVTSLVEELISPFLLPFLLLKLRSSALDIVDFFRSFTVEVNGVGDVCSFALMDVSRHGNAEWAGEGEPKTDHYQQAEHGKTELSLIHFATTNPNWESSPASRAFINQVKQQAQRHAKDLSESRLGNPLYTSLQSLQHPLTTLYTSCYFGEFASDMCDRTGQPALHQSMALPSTTAHNANPVVTGCYRTEGPVYGNKTGLMASVLSSSQNADSLHQSQDLDPAQLQAAEISFNSIYLHELRRRHLEDPNQRTQPGMIPLRQLNISDNPSSEHQPLLEVKTSSSI